MYGIHVVLNAVTAPPKLIITTWCFYSSIGKSLLTAVLGEINRRRYKLEGLLGGAGSDDEFEAMDDQLTDIAKQNENRGKRTRGSGGVHSLLSDSQSSRDHLKRHAKSAVTFTTYTTEHVISEQDDDEDLHDSATGSRRRKSKATRDSQVFILNVVIDSSAS